MRTGIHLFSQGVAAATGALIAVAAPGGLVAAAQESDRKISIDVSVDPRVELISLIFHLAGNHEYNQGRIRSYNHRIEDRFGLLRSHAAVRHATALGKTHYIGYDAPMSLAVRLTAPPALKERLPLFSPAAGLDTRWPADETREFLREVRAFAKQTNFTEFFKERDSFYALAVERMEKLLEQEFHPRWFEEFFGRRPGARFHVVLGMLNGGGNYGARVKIGEVEDLYCILGVSSTNWLGGPKFDSRCVPTIVHEFCHSYCNPFVDPHLKDLEKSGPKIYSRHETQMKKMAYGNWRSMMRESMVRASVVRYLHAVEGAEAAEREIARQRSRGFEWVEGLAKLLGEYEADRETWPTLESLVPKIVAFFDKYAEALKE